MSERPSQNERVSKNNERARIRKVPSSCSLFLFSSVHTQSSPAFHDSSWPSPRGWNIIALWLVNRYNIIFWLVGVLRGWEVRKTNQIAPPRMGGGSRLVENKNSRIWLAELTWIGGSDRFGSVRIGPRIQVFRTYHSHNHSYEYLRVTSFKLSFAVYFALFTVVLLLLSWKVFYLMK